MSEANLMRYEFRPQPSILWADFLDATAAWSGPEFLANAEAKIPATSSRPPDPEVAETVVLSVCNAGPRLTLARRVRGPGGWATQFLHVGPPAPYGTLPMELDKIKRAHGVTLYLVEAGPWKNMPSEQMYTTTIRGPYSSLASGINRAADGNVVFDVE